MTIRVAARAVIEAERRDRKARDLASPERRIQASARRFFLAQRLETMRRLDAELPQFFREGPFDIWASIWNAIKAATGADLAETIEREATLSARRGWDSAAVDFGMTLDWDVLDPEAVRYLRNRGATAVSGIDATTERELRRILSNGLANGDSYATTAAAISDRFAAYADGVAGGRPRAETIAIYETGQAYEHGRTMMADRLERDGLDVEKRWMLAGDGEECPICIPNGEADWIPNAEIFPSGDAAPLAHVNCRCDLEVRAA